MSEEDACEICDSIWSTRKNQILYCDGKECNMPVHQDCYGIESIPKDDWFCQLCDYKRRNLPWSIVCCTSQSGAFKRTTERGEFMHVLCAIWNRDIDHTVEPYLVKKSLMDKKQECYFCKKRQGLCIKCDAAECSRTFHVTCAVSGGWIDPETSDCPGQVRCKAHMRPVENQRTAETLKRKHVYTDSYDTHMRDLFGDDSSDEEETKKEDAASSSPLLLPRPIPSANRNRPEGGKKKKTMTTSLSKTGMPQANPSQLTLSASNEKSCLSESKKPLMFGHQRSLSEQSDKPRSNLLTPTTPNGPKTLHRPDLHTSSRTPSTIQNASSASPLSSSRSAFVATPKTSPITTPKTWLGPTVTTLPAAPKPVSSPKPATMNTPKLPQPTATKPSTAASKPKGTEGSDSQSSAHYADVVKRKLAKIVDTYFPASVNPSSIALQEQLETVQQDNQKLQQELARLRTFYKRVGDIFSTLNIDLPGKQSPKDDLEVYVDELRGLLGRTCPLNEREQAGIAASVDHLLQPRRPKQHK